MVLKIFKTANISWVIIAVLSVGLMIGCAGGTKEVKKDPFFEKWKVMAKECKGSSPAARTRTITVPPEPAHKVDAKTSEARLPTRKVSLKMRNADIKMVIRALARAADQNILIKYDIEGRVNVDFKQVPWNEAFLSILRSQMLTYVREGNIIRIATVEDLENDLKLKAVQEKKREKAPLVTMVTPIDFADPGKLAKNLDGLLTKDEQGNSYGSIKVSEHTNSLIIQATHDDLKKIVAMIEKIDKATAQILIEANIVETTKDMARNLGVQWGGMYANSVNGNQYFITPGGSGGTVGTNPVTSGGYSPAYGSTGISGHGYGMNFPGPDVASVASAAGGTGSLGLLFGTIGGSILDVQLNALQNDGRLNILSSPSIITIDNQTAFTENGEKVPYVSTDKDGNREVKFEDVVLRLEITPHVIDGQNLKMKINVKKDEINPNLSVLGNPAIFKKQTDTTLIVQDGETIVISGLTKQKKQAEDSGVPGMKDVPVLGWLFKGETKQENMEEVLIFITPHILKQESKS